jgi:hypothetical protein
MNRDNQELSLNYLVEFGSNVLMQKLRNLDLSLNLRLSLRRNHCGFEFD